MFFLSKKYIFVTMFVVPFSFGLSSTKPATNEPKKAEEKIDKTDMQNRCVNALLHATSYKLGLVDEKPQVIEEQIFRRCEKYIPAHQLIDKAQGVAVDQGRALVALALKYPKDSQVIEAMRRHSSQKLIRAQERAMQESESDAKKLSPDQVVNNCGQYYVWQKGSDLPWLKGELSMYEHAARLADEQNKLDVAQSLREVAAEKRSSNRLKLVLGGVLVGGGLIWACLR